MWVKSPKLCIIIKFHYSRLFERLNNAKRFGLWGQSGMQKQSEPVTPQIHAMPPPLSSGLLPYFLFYFIFCTLPPFCTVMGTERSHQAKASRAKSHRMQSSSQASQRKAARWSVLARMSISGVFRECVESRDTERNLTWDKDFHLNDDCHLSQSAKGNHERGLRSVFRI